MRIKKMLKQIGINTGLPIVIIPEAIDVEKGQGWPPDKMILVRNDKVYATMQSILERTPSESAVISTGLRDGPN